MNVERVQPLFFVISTLFAWWAIASAGYIVAKCIPGGAPCRPILPIEWGAVPTTGITTTADAAEQGTPSGEETFQTEAEQTSRTWWDYIPIPSKRDWLVMVSLLAALWVAKTMVYPYNDLSKPAT